MLIANNSKRIAKNTILLYFRMIFLMVITLFTSRAILDALGIEDFGIYNVVGGFVALFALISAALTSASTRFLNYEMGKDDNNRQNIVFSTALIIQFSLAFIVFILAEFIGVWYINNMMVIPCERLNAANWCFQISILSFCINLLIVPYNASIIAHEDMKVFAFVSIFDGCMKLIISLSVYISPIDKLVFYAFLLLLVQTIVCVTYLFFCKKNYIECTFRYVISKPLLKEMLGYSIWHLIGNGAGILKTHGINVLLNIYFGPIVNAARGISSQVESAVNQFSGNFIMAMNPQITKSYAQNDLKYMFTLLYAGSRFSFYLIYIISLPIILNTPFLLNVWLKEVPNHAILFTQLTLIAAIIATISRPLITAQNATGKVREYQIVVGLVLLLNLPVSYCILLLGFSPESVILVSVCIEVFALLTRIFMLKRTIAEFEPIQYLKRVCLICIYVILISVPLPLFCTFIITDSLYSFIFVSFTSVISSLIAIYLIGLNSNEKQISISYIKKLLHK